MNTNDATRATAEAMPADPSIRSLYREWDANHCHHNRKGAGYTEDEMAALCAENDIVMDQMCAMDSRSPMEVLAKLLAVSGKLEYSVNDAWVDSIRDEALAMLAESNTADTAGVGSVLPELLAAYESARAAINQHEANDVDYDDPVLKALCIRHCELALSICGHRPHSKAEQRIKAEFLRDWTECTLLNEQEQNALIASLMPEGGEA